MAFLGPIKCKPDATNGLCSPLKTDRGKDILSTVGIAAPLKILRCSEQTITELFKAVHVILNAPF